MPEQMQLAATGSRAELNERLHRFSHDLKNRLGGLWQALKLLKDLPEGPEREELMVFAERSYFSGAQAMEKLMDDLEVPRGVTDIRKEDLDLSALLADCVAANAYRTEPKQQHVEVSIAPAITLQGDPRLLRNLFEALLSNASKFSPAGTAVRFSALRDGQEVLVQVEDDGGGLTMEDLGQVFTRYAILSSRCTGGESQARGTLARARQWAEAHGGMINAFSEGPGKGSRFTVRLPLA